MSVGGKLSGRVALVTGASSGIGKASAIALHGEGAKVALVGRRAGPLQELAERLGDGALAIAADVTDEQAVADAVERASRQLGEISVVVNSAGVCLPRPVSELGGADWQRTISVNLSGTYFVSRETGLRMRDAGGGVIVNIGSEMGAMGAAGYVAYSASKAGVAGLTRALAVELAPKVTVNTVSPGPVDTPMLRAELGRDGDPGAALEKELARIPLRRLGTAEEVAKAVLYLATDAGCATGMTMALDGGTTIV
jgi:NAD(P)-dependent dehydrogenase (short-subunit alcohol dehydrogenase family)